MDMSREQITREAARLLYSRKVKEYKDAKEMAAKDLGTRSLPSNYDIAIELDNLTEEHEGSERLSRLVEMRRIALEVMRRLWDYDPVLIGSVWRGTNRQGSDIDIVVYHDDPEIVKENLREYNIIVIDKKTFILSGLPRSSAHLTLQVKEYPVEVVIRPLYDKEYYKDERCDVYGDIKRGLKLPELEKLIQTDPLRRFIPKRRSR
jgi:predicted nucleotidyltransferase